MKPKRRDVVGMRELIAIARAVGMGRDTTRAAVKIFRDTLRSGGTSKEVMAGRSYVVFEISSLYIACRGTIDERPMIDYIAAARTLTESRQNITLREMNRAVNVQRKMLDLKLPPYEEVETYVPIIIQRANLGDVTREKAIELAVLYKDVPTIRKRHNRSIAAGMIYAATVLYHTDVITQPQLAPLAGTSVTTIRLIMNAIRKKMNGKKSKVRFTVRKHETQTDQ
jgi:transcription initiation factor TFIIIB Brf1 subunit/transcription initiation factor TFIIB